MTDPSIWNKFFMWPILNLLIGFYKMISEAGVPGALGFAIITLTILIRVILYPLMNKQLKSAKKMAAIKPEIDKLNEKHKDDKQALQKAQIELYQKHGINPAAGCLPLLVQFPVLIALYRVFFQVLNNGNLDQVVSDINTIIYHPSLSISSLELDFFGANLASKPSQWQEIGVWILSVPLITGLLQWVQTKTMMQNQPKPTKKSDSKKEDTAADIQKQMAMITPIMFGFFAYQFPLGLALYWNVFGLFGIMQQRIINNSTNHD